MTMRFFQLRDDMTLAGRWHLGQVTAPDGSEPTLDGGERIQTDVQLVAEVNHPGFTPDFSLTSYAVPIVTSKLAQVIAAIAGRDVQTLPVKVVGGHEMSALNAIRAIRCVDESRSEFVKWTQQDHRFDLAGQYRQVTKLVLDIRAVPPDAHFFRVKGWLIALIVSETIKNAMEHAGCVGAKFIDVTQLDMQ